MPCAICQVRKPRRFCPGVGGDICSICCGSEREKTVTCPLDCPYLQEAHRHERFPPANPDEFPNRDIKVSDDLLQSNEALLVFTGRKLMTSALETPGAVDYDVRDALESLIRTYRSLQSGIYYETRPDNSLARAIYDQLQASLDEFRKAETRERGLSKTRDSDVLGILAFLQRLELDRNNGRPRGRAFLDFLRSYLVPPEEAAIAPSSSLIIP
jgi:hypothetical protein